MRSEPADESTIVISSDTVELELLAQGASVRRLWVPDAHGGRRNVVLGYASAQDYGVAPHFFGATIGRYANRIHRGQFDLDGTAYRIPPNEGAHALHGGPDGFDKRVWTVVGTTSSSARMVLDSPDGDQGFPGSLRVELTWTVVGAEVRLDYRATTDTPTVVNLTNHSYFNLDGEGAASIDGHVLSVDADGYTPTDASLIPTGQIATVEGTPFDWRAPQQVGPVIRQPHPQLIAARGLDHNLALNGAGLRPVATLRSPASGISVEIVTDQAGLQVYTGNSLDGTTRGTSGGMYRQGAGIALETQCFPDSPNQPTFPSAVLRPGQEYRTTTAWRFTAVGS